MTNYTSNNSTMNNQTTTYHFDDENDISSSIDSSSNTIPTAYTSSIISNDTTYYSPAGNNNNYDSSNNNDTDDGQHMIRISAYFVLFSALLTIVLILSKYLHDRPQLATVYPEAAMVLTVGIVAGFIINTFIYFVQYNSTNDNTKNNDDVIVHVKDLLLQFSPEIFFLFLLPPIIFNSGYHLRRELFFRHIVPITLYSVVGTTVSAIVIAIVLQFVQNIGWTGTTSFQPYFTELLTFGGLISATDPVSTLAVFQTKCVDPQLFYLVFGESVLNDAVGLVLFNAFSKFVTDSNANTGEVVIDMGEFVFSFILDSIGSPILGLLCGCCTALLFKYTNMKEHKLLELCVYVLIMYVPFLLAQVMGLSGIVTILFTGMTAKAYVVPNLSIETERTAEMLFRLFAHIAETSIFLELGLSVSGLASQSFHGMFIFWTLIACIIGRICNVYPITVIYNWRLRYLPTNPDEIKQHRIHDKNDNQMNEMSEISNDSGDGYNDHFGDDDDNVQSIPHVRRSKDNKQVTKNDSRHGKVCLTNLPSELDGIMKNQPQHKKKSNIPSSDVSSYETTTPAVRRDLIIRPKTAHMLCFSGLRGAVAYACARSFPNTYGNRTEFIFLTMAIVLITVFAFGSTTEPMLNMLKIDMNVDENKYMDDWNKKRQQASCILRWEEFIQRHVTREETCNEQYTHSKVSTNDQDETSCRHIASSDDDDNKNKTDVRNDEKMQHQIVGDDVVDEEKLGIMHEGIRQGYTSPSNHGLKRQLHSRRVETSLFDFGGL